MSETLKNYESNHEHQPTGYEGLSALEFNKEKAEQAVQEKKQELAKDAKPLAFLEIKPKTEKLKPVDELSPKDAANEYLALLDELSQDFTNPYYSEERKGQHHYANNITTELGRKYSSNPHYRWRGYASTEAGETDGTMLRIAGADSILASEIGWRTEGEKVGKKMEQVDKNIADLDADYSKKGRLGKILSKRKYEKARNELEQTRRTMEYQFNQKYNGSIAKELAISYNEKGDYDYNGGDYGKSQNEARNRRFFGLDDPERAKKIERAIELRMQHESEWKKQ